jgi:osmotically-inducible protein OsmY
MEASGESALHAAFTVRFYARAEGDVRVKTDEELQQEVVDELAAEVNLDASTIGVAVKDGAVVLLGVVPSVAERHIAERLVRRIAGVRAVVDKLQTADAAPHRV